MSLLSSKEERELHSACMDAFFAELKQLKEHGIDLSGTHRDVDL